MGETYTHPGSTRVADTTARDGSNLILLGRIVALATGAVVALLAFRFSLLLLNANLGAGFTQFIYSVSAPFVAPFRDVFRVIQAGDGTILEWSSLLALSVYALVGGFTSRLLTALGRRRLILRFATREQERPAQPVETVETTQQLPV